MTHNPVHAKIRDSAVQASDTNDAADTTRRAPPCSRQHSLVEDGELGLVAHGPHQPHVLRQPCSGLWQPCGGTPGALIPTCRQPSDDGQHRRHLY